MFDFFKEKNDCQYVYIIAEAYNNDPYSTIFTKAIAAYGSYGDAINALQSNQYIIGPLPHHKIENPDCQLVNDYQKRDPNSPRQSPKTRRKD